MVHVGHVTYIAELATRNGRPDQSKWSRRSPTDRETASIVGPFQTLDNFYYAGLDSVGPYVIQTTSIPMKTESFRPRQRLTRCSVSSAGKRCSPATGQTLPHRHKVRAREHHHATKATTPAPSSFAPVNVHI